MVINITRQESTGDCVSDHGFSLGMDVKKPADLCSRAGTGVIERIELAVLAYLATVIYSTSENLRGEQPERW